MSIKNIELSFTIISSYKAEFILDLIKNYFDEIETWFWIRICKLNPLQMEFPGRNIM